MLRTYLWVSECRIADDIRRAWEKHLGVLKRELADATQRQKAATHPEWAADRRDEITRACHRAASALLVELEAEVREAAVAHDECADVLFRLTSRLGQALGKQTAVSDAAGTPLLETLVPLREQLADATARLEALMLQDREKLHDLAVQEDFRRRSAGSSSSVPLSDIDTTSPSRFVDLVERLLQRDGFETARPDSPGSATFVSATCPKGHVLLISAHHVDGPTQGWRPDPPADVGAPTLHATRLAAGDRARDLVVVTNGGFSRPARRYAAAHGMVRLSRKGLQRWAEWEEPLECAEEGHEQDAA
ncbi:restriction endonuclease [Streptomyces sp. NPDC057889]|uniref:restriction endonuclease n=1 Tax=unclassified Streptomyces TaxID=2593676 RepID=UPI0036B68D93